MDRIDSPRSILVLVDYQARLMPAIHDADRVAGEACLLADAARLLDVPVLGTEQNPAGLGPNVPAIRDRCTTTIGKMHFDACADGLLPAIAREAEGRGGRDAQVVIAGCEAHVCLLQSALGVLRAGYRMFVVAPACGSRSPRDHQLAMARLEGAGATIVSTEMAVFEWLDSCRHPRFKEVLALLKNRPL